MSGRSPRATSLTRWRLAWLGHSRGRSVRDIAAGLGISPRLVRYYLAKGEHPEITARRQGTKPVVVPPVVPSPDGKVVPLRRAGGTA